MLQCLPVPVRLYCSMSGRACCVFNAYNHKSPLCVCVEFYMVLLDIMGVLQIFIFLQREAQIGD